MHMPTCATKDMCHTAWLPDTRNCAIKYVLYCLPCCLQGEYVGLRSAAAGFRFLQPRRKAPNRLVFFNLNLGIWEQWEVS